MSKFVGKAHNNMSKFLNIVNKTLLFKRGVIKCNKIIDVGGNTMKTLKKTLAVLISVMMIFGSFAVISFAAEETVTAKFLSFNVAGLPDFKALLGQSEKDVPANETEIGKMIEENGYDIVAVQEDFGYHSNLVEGMKSYNYQTKHSGSIPGGDGLNVYTKNAKIYDASRIPWNVCFGDIAEGDTLTPKGIIYTVLELGNGIYVDFYDLHADAFDGDGSALARADQYKQLIELVNKNSADRPVIITGDFNTSLHITNSGNNAADERAMLEVIKEEGGFKDAWIELKNGGDYQNFSSWYATGVSYWGNWDSVEKFYYRDGGGVEITANDFEYKAFLDADGQNLSDHNAAVCTFTFTKTVNFTEDTREHKVNNPSDFSIFLNTLKWIIKDLSYVFSNFDQIIALIK